MPNRRLFRINLWLHRWSSLIATPFFLVLCITGNGAWLWWDRRRQPSPSGTGATAKTLAEPAA